MPIDLYLGISCSKMSLRSSYVLLFSNRSDKFQLISHNLYNARRQLLLSRSMHLRALRKFSNYRNLHWADSLMEDRSEKMQLKSLRACFGGNESCKCEAIKYKLDPDACSLVHVKLL